MPFIFLSALRCLGSHCHHRLTIPEAPLRSRTVGFPESGSDLGSSGNKPSCIFSHLKRWPAILRLYSLSIPSPRYFASHFAGSVFRCVQSIRNHQVPRAPLLRRHYPPSPLLRAHASIPSPPSRFDIIYRDGLCSLTNRCWSWDLPDIISSIFR